MNQVPQARRFKIMRELSSGMQEGEDTGMSCQIVPLEDTGQDINPTLISEDHKLE